MKFIVTIDTEGDNQWDHGRDLTVENIKFVPRFQALCDEYGIKPTYLVTSEVCQDKYARDLFSRYISDGSAEDRCPPAFLDYSSIRGQGWF